MMKLLLLPNSPEAFAGYDRSVWNNTSRRLSSNLFSAGRIHRLQRLVGNREQEGTQQELSKDGLSLWFSFTNLI